MADKIEKTGPLRNIGLWAVSAWESALRTGREEDGLIDWTTLGSLPRPEVQVTAKIIAKSEGVWAAQGLIRALSKIEPAIHVRELANDGERLREGDVACEWTGPACDILVYERPFLNLASYVGGIATRTARLVELVTNACPERAPRVTPTRKILPGYRDLGIVGVMAGGGFSHRVNLSGGVLIKENHIAAAGGVSVAIEKVRRIAPHGLRIEIEVRSLEELAQAIETGVDAVLLDHFSPEQVRTAVASLDRARVRPIVEVSGGLNEENIARFAVRGVDVLSVGSLTHSVTATDLSLLVDERKQRRK